MRLYHITFESVEKFVPRIPINTYETEDRTIPRICVTPNIQKAFQAAPMIGNILKAFLDNKMHPIIYIYSFDLNEFDRNEYKTPFEVNSYVKDAIQNQEYWLLKSPEKVSLRKVYVTNAWLRKMEDMFGVEEYFCMNAELKTTKSKKTNYDLILEHFYDSKYKDFIESITELETVSFRSKMKYLIEENILKIKEEDINGN